MQAARRAHRGRRDAEHRHVGGLALPGILARGLAERRGARFGVEHIVHHLEGEPYRLGVAVKASARARAERRAARGADQHRSADQRAGLVDVHELELGQRECPSRRREIDTLPTRHAA